MIYRLDVDGPTRKLIQHLPPPRKKIVKESLRSIAFDPNSGKALRDELQGLYSYRVGTLRIIYAINKKQKYVHVIAIGPRRMIYEAVTKERRKK